MYSFARTCFTALAVFAAISVQAQIRVGQTAGFTGTVGPGVKETTLGAQLLINAVNSRGGIHGQKIELISLDDKFDPKLAAANAQQLIEAEEVLVLFLNRGTPHTEAIIPLLDKHGVALVAPSTGAMLLHQPVKKHVFNVRATYQREAEKAVQHLASVGIQRISLVQVDDSFGADAVAGARRRSRGTPRGEVRRGLGCRRADDAGGVRCDRPGRVRVLRVVRSGRGAVPVARGVDRTGRRGCRRGEEAPVERVV